MLLSSLKNFIRRDEVVIREGIAWLDEDGKKPLRCQSKVVLEVNEVCVSVQIRRVEKRMILFNRHMYLYGFIMPFGS